MSVAQAHLRPQWRSRLRLRLRNGRLAMLSGGALLGVWLLLALFAPWLAPYDPIYQNTELRLLAPHLAHPFGTDNFGRDILSRVIWAARVDLQICVIGVVFPFMIGTFVGALSGYIGGRFDNLCMRLIDIVLAFPFLVLMLAIIAILGPGLSSFYIAMALVGWVSYARLIRSQILVLKESDFALAAKSLGFGHLRILFRHLLPNAMFGSIVFSMSDAVLVLLSGASVSYLGLGVQPPLAEWGTMVAEGQAFLTSAWWICTFPGLAIVTLAMCFSLLADGVAETLGERR
ncbi:ABC transporter permease [Pseudomonas syringae]|uniref:ABC transporter permease n=1 Tax=Pseudomonas syringae TaxID=317 RepID=UPI0002097963|nr:MULTISPECIES: ABC transporter permease [Pseudomonas syringae group]EGH98484.1 peptide ABC transporter, permease protein [Pseudomonas amygdali pv. lachrymans str. M302278]KPC08872.1 Peptide ABC transporter [Pseudomonas amygdali pv. lachrymans]RMM08418.1 Peptide ABC transporter, permease protein [Pseudomonas syringae]